MAIPIAGGRAVRGQDDLGRSVISMSGAGFYVFHRGCSVFQPLEQPNYFDGQRVARVGDAARPLAEGIQVRVQVEDWTVLGNGRVEAPQP